MKFIPTTIFLCQWASFQPFATKETQTCVSVNCQHSLLTRHMNAAMSKIKCNIRLGAKVFTGLPKLLARLLLVKQPVTTRTIQTFGGRLPKVYNTMDEALSN